MYIASGADVTLELDSLSENYFRAYAGNAAIRVEEGATLTITGRGKLMAWNRNDYACLWRKVQASTGGDSIDANGDFIYEKWTYYRGGAGIGGYSSDSTRGSWSNEISTGTIIIRGYAQVDAKGGLGSAGIGGARGGNGFGNFVHYKGRIIIKESARVYAYGGGGGGGIGAGAWTNGNVSSVRIEGGYVDARSLYGDPYTGNWGKSGGAGIGGSAGNGVASDSVIITGGYVYAKNVGCCGSFYPHAGIWGHPTIINGNAVVYADGGPSGYGVNEPQITQGVVYENDKQGRVYGRVVLDFDVSLSGNIYVPPGDTLIIPDTATQWDGRLDTIQVRNGNYILPYEKGGTQGGAIYVTQPRLDETPSPPYGNGGRRIEGLLLDYPFDLKEQTTNSLTFGTATRLAVTEQVSNPAQAQYRIQDIEYFLSTNPNLKGTGYTYSKADSAFLIIDSTATGLPEVKFTGLKERTMYYLYARSRPNASYYEGIWTKSGQAFTLLIPNGKDFIITPKTTVYNGATQYPVITANKATIPSFIPLDVDDITAVRYNGSTDIPQVVNPYKVSVDIPAKTGFFVKATDMALSDSFKITPAKLVVTPTAGQHKDYGDPDPVLTYSVTGFVGGENQSVMTGQLGRVPGDTARAGGYPITIGTLAAPNYTIDLQNSTFEIRPKTVIDENLELRVDYTKFNPLSCAGGWFEDVIFLLYEKNAQKQLIPASPFKVIIEYDSGDQILKGEPQGFPYITDNGKFLAGYPVITGKGTYRAHVIDVISNPMRKSKPITFTLEARQILSDYVNKSLKFPAVTYRNGDVVGAVNLTELVPEKVRISWTNSNAAIGLAASGAGIVPEFIAANTGATDITATITYTLAYEDDAKCSTATVTQSITVKPKVNLDASLTAAVTVSNPMSCANAKFGVITFSAKDNGAAVSNGVTYRIELVGGDPIISGIPATQTTATWEPMPTIAGKALYRVVPIYQNREGAAATFSLEARKPLAEIADGLKFAATTYQNGDIVQAVNLNDLVPAGVRITWANNNANIGLAATGAGSMPTYTAKNTGTTDATATITYTLTYSDGKGCTNNATTTQTITVKPKTNLDLDLVAGASITNPVTCSGVAFGAVALSAKDNGTAVTSGVAYRVELVSGDPIISGIPTTVTATSWNPGSPILAGKAIYRIIPFYQNREGVAVTISLEARRPLTEIASGLQFATANYKSGDHIQAVNLNALVPEGVKISWTNNKPDIGLSTSGAGYIPEFTATNTSNADITATITYTLEYSDGKGCTAKGTATQTINVKPKTNLDLDLVAAVEVTDPVACAGSAFAAVKFSVKDRGTAITSGVTYRVELVSGDPIISGVPATTTVATWTPQAVLSGNAVYRVIPIYQNREGQAAIFALEARKSLTEIATGLQFAQVTYLNGDRVQAINLDALVPEGINVTWANNNVNIGLAASGAGIVPEFTAINTGTSELKAVITYTLAYSDGKGCKTSVNTTQNITVKPRVNLDATLTAGVTVSNPITCSGVKFAAITFAAKDNGTAVTSGVTYRVEFAGGDPIIGGLPLTMSTAAWEPTPTQSGKAILRVIPIYQNREGEGATFALEARKPLTEIADGLQFAAISYYNGDRVQAVNLNALVPEGIKITWVNNNPAIGLAASGAGIMPEFTASNTGSANITATITYTIAYSDGKGCTTNATATQIITIMPKSVMDADLTAEVSISSPVTCTTAAFTAITFSARDHGTPVTNGVNYRIELVSGDPIISNIPVTLTTSTWNPGIPVMAGKAIYRVVPIYQNREGAAAIFALEVRPTLAQYVNSGSNLNYRNGDWVETIPLTTTLPQDVIVEWWISGDDIGLDAHNGVGALPSFHAVNTTNADLKAFVNFTLKYDDGLGNSCNTTIYTRQIIVSPYTVQDLDLIANPVASQTKYFDEEFDNITFTASRISRTILNNVSYLVEFVSGTDVINTPNLLGAIPASANGLWEISKAVNRLAGHGTYRVTPRAENNEGKPTIFNLTITEKMEIHVSSDIITYCEEETTNPIIIEGLPHSNDYYITWTGGDFIGLADNDGSVKKYHNIPAFKAIAENLAEDNVATIIVTPHVISNGRDFAGDAISFEIIVHPETRLVADSKGILEFVTPCANDNLILKVNATGTDLTYQWYKDGSAIEGAHNAEYEIGSVKETHIGRYHAVINGKCGSIESKTYVVSVRLDLVEQRWNDVLISVTDSARNGGHKFVSFQWYVVNNGKATMLTDENRSYLYVEGGLDLNSAYFVEATSSLGEIIRSCPFTPQEIKESHVTIYPNPIRAGAMLTADLSIEQRDINQTKIQLLDINGSVISDVKASANNIQIRMPNNRGIYILHVTIGDSVKSYKIIVE
jgi:hypothetical protein